MLAVIVQVVSGLKLVRLWKILKKHGNKYFKNKLNASYSHRPLTGDDVGTGVMKFFYSRAFVAIRSINNILN